MEIVYGLKASQYPYKTFLTATADRGGETLAKTRTSALPIPIRIIKKSSAMLKYRRTKKKRELEQQIRKNFLCM
jgi:hypothetical protein